MGLGSALCNVGCSTGHKEAEEKTNFLVTSPLQMDTSIVKQYVCQIRAISHIEVRTLEKGYLQDIYVDEGQRVQKGQLLFRIMPKLYEAERQRAQAEARVAEIEVQNTKALSDKNVVSKNELAMAQAKYDKTKAELSLANVHLGFTEIRAPFNGIIDRFQTRLGSLLDEGQLLTTLSDKSQMWVYFNVPEAEYLNFRQHAKGDTVIPVSLIMANNEPFAYPGQVRALEADFDNETGNIAFRATFPNPEGLLRHGETGNILVRQPIRNAIIIPQKATMEVMDKKYIFLIDKNNVVHQTLVEIEAEMPDLYVIRSGIAAGDRLLLEGLRKVKDKDRISYTYQSPQSVIANLTLHSE